LDFETRLETDLNSYYDIASLTKTFTATIVLKSIQKNIFKLTSKAYNWLPFLTNFPSIALENLLNHTSGLDIIQKFNKENLETSQHLTKYIFNSQNLQQQPASKYSDLNYIYLGLILEKVYSQNLEQIFSDFFKEFGLTGILFNPLSKDILRSKIAPSDGALQIGQISDEKARILNYPVAHAGLFATPQGLMNFTEKWLKNDFNFSKVFLNSAYGNNFQISNSLFSNPKFGLVFRRGMYSLLPNHAGFTGPSIFLNPEKNQAFVTTANYNYPQRTPEKRQKFINWNQELGQLFEIYI